MRKAILLTVVFVSTFACLISDASAASFKICANAITGALNARPKCKSGETLLTATSFQGPAGATGAAGAAGATGARGLSAFDPIPSGVTVFGVIGFDGDDDAGASPHDWYGFASLPAKISQVLTSNDVIIANSANVDTECLGGTGACLSAAEVADSAACTGSAETPTAPAGKVCIYISSLSASKISSGTVVGLVLNSAATITPGFMIGSSTGANGDTYIRAVWAYTAP